MFCSGIRLIFLGIIIVICGQVQAQEVDTQEVDRGKLLYENHCGSCHTPEVHERKDKKVKSHVELSKMVIRWQYYLKLDWSYDEVSQVSAFLNRRYYKFAMEP